MLYGGMKAFKHDADALEQLLRSRIVILDGPMGTMIQTFKLDESTVPQPIQRSSL
jgi:methionine synthase I (cobalamin-dependent)